MRKYRKVRRIKAIRHRKLPKQVLEARAGRAMVRAARAFYQVVDLLQQLR